MVFWGVFQPEVPSREAAARCHVSTNIPGATCHYVNLPRSWPWQWPQPLKPLKNSYPPRKVTFWEEILWGPNSLDINNPFRFQHPRYHFCHPLQVASKGLQLGRTKIQLSTGKSTKLRIFQNDKMRNGDILGLFKVLFWEYPTEAS